MNAPLRKVVIAALVMFAALQPPSCKA